MLPPAAQSVNEERAVDHGVLEKLIEELVAQDGMMVVLDSGGAVAEMHTKRMKSSEFKDGWAMIESADWHVHLNLATVEGAQFVEADDRWHDDIPKLYYLRLSDAEHGTLMRFYFPNPWLDENEKPTEFQPERLKAFKEFRDRYVGLQGVELVQRLAEADEAT